MRLTTPCTPDPLNFPCRKHVEGEEGKGREQVEEVRRERSREKITQDGLERKIEHRRK